MSMIGYAGAVTGEQVSAFRTDPALVADYVDDASGRAADTRREALLATMPPDVQTRYREQFAAAQRDLAIQMGRAPPSRATSALESLGPFAPILDLDKDWHALHYLLGGHLAFEGAPGDSLLGGEPLGPDLGYGPARLLSPSDTAAFSDFLTPLDADRVAARLSPPDMNRLGIYGLPFNPDQVELGALTDGLRARFEALKAYVTQAASVGNALLLWIS